MNTVHYAGFWIRFVAFLIDSVLVLMVIAPLLTAIYGAGYWTTPPGTLDGTTFRFWDFLLTYVLPAAAFILFWIYRSATPGKLLLRLRIVDAQTGGKPSTGQLIGRYLAYYVSMFPLMLGFAWVGWDKRKQGWHDKLAGTVVIKADGDGNQA